ncbi:MAG: methyltransferase type 11 [Phycisphaeraceae bacterium]|nr:methyltransferase type 11 [Phycisphaeraceae bacterium]
MIRVDVSMLIGVAVLAAAGCAQRSGHDHHHDHHHHMHHRFDDPEKWAARWNDPDRDAWQRPREVVGLLDIEPGMTVADLGTGTGYFLPHLSEAVGASGRVLALDVSKEMIDYIGSAPATSGLHKVEGRVVASDDPGLADGSVDRILVVNTWHHIADRVPYTRRLARALAPGGAVVIVDFTLDAPEGPPQAMRLAPEQVMRELEAGGLRPELLKESLPRHYVVAGRGN